MSRRLERSGPKQGMPVSRSLSTSPRASGSSGDHHGEVHAVAFGKVHACRPYPWRLMRDALRRPRRCRRCPAEHRSSSPVGFSRSFLMMACSRPPPPITRRFIVSHSPFLSMMEQPQAGEGHDHAVFVARCRSHDRPGWSRPAPRCRTRRYFLARSTLSPKGKKASEPTVTPDLSGDPGFLFLRGQRLGLDL